MCQPLIATFEATRRQILSERVRCVFSDAKIREADLIWSTGILSSQRAKSTGLNQIKSE